MLEPVALSAAQAIALADEIATFSARIDVAQHALLTRLRQFDAAEAWGRMGFLSTAQWLAWRTHIGPNAAREKVRVARALAELPKLDALFAQGKISYSKVRAITRVATAQTEQYYIDVAGHATAAQIELLTRNHQRCRTLAAGRGSDPLPADLRRFVRWFDTIGGMVRFEMQFAQEEAKLVKEALASACEQLAAGGCSSAGDESGQTCEVQAGTDAGNVSAEGLAGEGDDESGQTCGAQAGTNAENVSAETPEAEGQACFDAVSPPNSPEARADAMIDLAGAYLRERPRTLGSAYELVILTSKPLLEHGEDGVGGILRDGTPVPLAVVQRLASDSARVEVVVGEHGEVLDVGRRSRTIPAAIARALWLRDGGCRVPGCGRTRHLHAHHVQPWAQGGATKLSNLALVCTGHHRMIHEELLECAIVDGKLRFVDALGRRMPAAAPTAANGRDLEELELFLRRAGLRVDASLTEPRWDGTPMRLGEVLDWMLLAERNAPKA